MKRFFAGIALLWQLPFSILSYCFYHGARLTFRKNVMRLIGRLFAKKKKLQQGNAPAWVGLSEMLKQPVTLPYLMICCPRWNCHAAIGSVGPFTVTSSIDIQVEAARKSAGQWTFVIRKEDGKTQTFLSSNGVNGKSWEKIKLEPGQYNMVLRYYNCNGNVVFPGVKIDDAEKITSRSMNSEREGYQNFLNQYRNHRSILYYWMHYHVFNLLRWKKWLPRPYVLKTYLPGTVNPNTRYFYGSLKKGNILDVNVDPNLLRKFNLYITVYNISGFPALWESIVETEYRSQPAPCDGTYLIRLQGKGEDKYIVEENMVNCAILSDGGVRPASVS